MPRRVSVSRTPRYASSVRSSALGSRRLSTRFASRRFKIKAINRGHRWRKTRGSLIPQFAKSHPFPVKLFKPLLYTEMIRLTTGAAGVFGAIQKFRLNSLFDPDETGTGHQPYGRDTMAAIYNRYKVHACNIKMTLIDPSSDGVCVGCMLNGPSTTSDTLAGLTIEQVGERNMASVKFINNSGGQVKKYFQKIFMADVMGVTRQQYRNDLDNTTAAMGGNPADEITFQMAAADIRGDTSRDVVVKIDILYKIEFTERITLAQS